MTILFQTYSPKYPNTVILAPNLIFSLFCTIFCISANSRMLIPNIAIVFSNFQSKILKRTILVSNLRISIFTRNFFKLTTQNYTTNTFLAPKLKLFVLHDLPFCKSEGTHSKYDFFFKDFSLKISRKEHFCPKFKDVHL